MCRVYVWTFEADKGHRRWCADAPFILAEQLHIAFFALGSRQS